MGLVDCPCGRHRIDEREKICPYCGVLIENFTKTRALPKDEEEENSIPRWGTARFNTRMNLVLTLVDAQQSFVFDASEITEIGIGRRDPETGMRPALDLEPFGAIEKGVSRRHAVIVRRDTGSLQIIDRGSPNGTFLNGQRLVPHQPRILRDGDELRIGMMALLVRFERPPQ